MTVMSLLMAALIVNLTWIQVVDARALQNHAANTRNLAEQTRDDRGSILTRDGVTLAESKQGLAQHLRARLPQALLRRPHRRLLQRALRPSRHRGRRERRARRRQARLLDAGATSSMPQPGARCPGNDVVLTLDSRVQKAAEKSLAGRDGACVVIDPRTGAVLAAAANPGFDPEQDRLGLGGAQHRPGRTAHRPLAQRAVRTRLDVQGRHAHRRARHRRRRHRATRSPAPAR